MAGSTRLEHPLILHKSPEIYLELLQAAASDRNIPAVYGDILPSDDEVIEAIALIRNALPNLAVYLPCART